MMKEVGNISLVFVRCKLLKGLFSERRKIEFQLPKKDRD